MAKNNRPKRPMTKGSNLDVIRFTDARTKKIRFFKKKDFETELKKIYDTITATLPKIGKIGKYQLKDIELSVGVSGNFVVVTVEGGITLRYSYP
jgi:hypothetical protein